MKTITDKSKNKNNKIIYFEYIENSTYTKFNNNGILYKKIRMVKFYLKNINEFCIDLCC